MAARSASHDDGQPPAAEDDLDQLNATIDQLEAEIQATIVHDYEPLLAHIAKIKTSGARLGELEQRIQSVQDVQMRLRRRVRIPYEHLTLYTNQLENLHAASEAVAQLSKFFQLTRRLRLLLDTTMTSITTPPISSPKTFGAIDESDDRAQRLITAAVTLREIDRLPGIEPHRTRVAKLSAELDAVDELRSRLINGADHCLGEGFRRSHQPDLAVGVQIYHHLGRLGPPLTALLDEELAAFATAVATWLNFTAGPKDPKVSTAATGNKFWDLLDVLLDSLAAAATKVYTLEKVLVRKRDGMVAAGGGGSVATSSQAPTLLDAVVSELGTGPVTYFWQHIAEHLLNLFQRLLQTQSAVGQTLVTNYPKLLLRLHSLYSVLAPLQSHATAAVSTTTVAGSPTVHDRYDQVPENVLLLRSFGALEAGYLARLEARLGDLVATAFGIVPGATGVSGMGPGGSGLRGAGTTRSHDPQPVLVPARGQITVLVRNLFNELEITQFDSALSARILQLIMQQLTVFLRYTEKMVSTDSKAYFIGYSDATKTMPTPQLTNADLINAVGILNDQVRLNLAKFPKLDPTRTEATAQLAPRVLNRILSPLVEHILFSIQGTVGKMHAEGAYATPPSSSADGPNATPNHQSAGQARYSVYMIELAHRIRYIRRLIEKLDLPADPCRADLVRTLGARALLLFVRHISLVPNLRDTGKMQVTEDATQLEFSLTQLLARAKLEVKDLGDPYQALREFRTVLFMEIRQIPGCCGSHSVAIGDGKQSQGLSGQQQQPRFTSLPTSTVVQYLIGQCHPKDIPTTPAAHLGLSLPDYSDWLDTHSEAEALAMLRELVGRYVLTDGDAPSDAAQALRTILL
ncbi:hypothetical protein IWQ60_010753 [Tieghemiomyces parasiticus]|uniref:Conserved oligomeric Golgi complex subunit 5 n=1 Tax=Tieghemiomyces parasiticus TaxID=78921 RepID=A0A9W7ZPZ9_9FUNG|nr:hypothetical protein IWQ60_010753 [Tieghemiomyces parasiticus]